MVGGHGDLYLEKTPVNLCVNLHPLRFEQKPSSIECPNFFIIIYYLFYYSLLFIFLIKKSKKGLGNSGWDFTQ